MAGTVLVTGAPARSCGGWSPRASRSAPTHTPAKAAHLERAGIATVALDLDRPDTWPPALDGIEQVFFVGYVGPRFAETSGALAAARRAGARRLVKLSASFCWWWFGGARRSNAPVGLAPPDRVVLGGVGF
jgi:hypothetical protein